MEDAEIEGAEFETAVEGIELNQSWSAERWRAQRQRTQPHLLPSASSSLRHVF